MELVRDARLDAKIDLQKNIVTMNVPVYVLCPCLYPHLCLHLTEIISRVGSASIHQTISDRSRQLLERAQYILPAPAQSGDVSGQQGRGQQDQKKGGSGPRRDNDQRRGGADGVGQGQTPRPVEVK